MSRSPSAPELGGPSPRGIKRNAHDALDETDAAVLPNHSLDEQSVTPDGSAARDTETRKVNKRSRAGCLTCRKRRVKCDETRPVCGGCGERAEACEWPVPKQEPSRHKHPRAITSCKECRARKTKCDINSTTPCTSCSQQGLSCSGIQRAGSLRPKERSQQPSAAGPSHVPPSFSDTPQNLYTAPTNHPAELCIRAEEQTMINDLVRLYFTTVHYFGFLTFLHEADYWERSERGDLPVGLTLLIAANALRFGGRPDAQSWLHLADRWAAEAGERLIGQAMMEFGAVELMEVVLYHHYEFQCGRYSRGWVLAGMAVRMMTFLRLHIFDESPHPIMKPLLGAESLRRLAWSVYYLDATIDGGNYGFTAIPDGAFTISLPCDEKPFLQHVPTTKEYMLPTIPPPLQSDLGLAGYLLRAMYARQILAGLHSRIQRDLVPVSSIFEFVKQAETEALQLLGTLPFDMLYNRTNFHIHKSQQPLFLHLHVIRNTCSRHIALLKMLTTSYALDHFDIPTCRRQLIEDASALSGFFAQALDHGTVLDPQLAMHAYNGLEILLYQPIRSMSEMDNTSLSRHDVSRLITPLLRVIRETARVSELVALLHPEAVNRMVRLGFSKELLDEDMLAVLKKVHRLANPDTEFDFHDSFWRYEVAVARHRGDVDLPVSPNDLLLEVKSTPSGHIGSPLTRFQSLFDNNTINPEFDPTPYPANSSGEFGAGLPVEDLHTLMGSQQQPVSLGVGFDWSTSL